MKFSLVSFTSLMAALSQTTTVVAFSSPAIPQSRNNLFLSLSMQEDIELTRQVVKFQEDIELTRAVIADFIQNESMMEGSAENEPISAITAAAKEDSS